jgi:hypothetical protein
MPGRDAFQGVLAEHRQPPENTYNIPQDKGNIISQDNGQENIRVKDSGAGSYHITETWKNRTRTSQGSEAVRLR